MSFFPYTHYPYTHVRTSIYTYSSIHTAWNQWKFCLNHPNSIGGVKKESRAKQVTNLMAQKSTRDVKAKTLITIHFNTYLLRLFIADAKTKRNDFIFFRCFRCCWFNGKTLCSIQISSEISNIFAKKSNGGGGSNSSKRNAAREWEESASVCVCVRFFRAFGDKHISLSRLDVPWYERASESERRESRFDVFFKRLLFFTPRSNIHESMVKRTR